MERTSLHEFVHICQQQVEANCYGCIWFWEALATNLAGQVMGPVELTCDREELMFHYQELPNAYAISYRLGKFFPFSLDRDFFCNKIVLKRTKIF